MRKWLVREGEVVELCRCRTGLFGSWCNPFATVGFQGRLSV